MLTFVIFIFGLLLVVTGARGLVSFVGDRRKGRVWRQREWAGAIGWLAMLSLFFLILVNL